MPECSKIVFVFPSHFIFSECWVTSFLFSLSLMLWHFYHFLVLFFYFQIRTLGMLRSRFLSLPGAFNACLIPEEKSEPPKKKGLKTTLSRNFAAVMCNLEFFFFFFLIVLVDLLSDNCRKSGNIYSSLFT